MVLFALCSMVCRREDVRLRRIACHGSSRSAQPPSCTAVWRRKRMTSSVAAGCIDIHFQNRDPCHARQSNNDCDVLLVTGNRRDRGRLIEEGDEVLATGTSRTFPQDITATGGDSEFQSHVIARIGQHRPPQIENSEATTTFTIDTIPSSASRPTTRAGTTLVPPNKSGTAATKFMSLRQVNGSGTATLHSIGQLSGLQPSL